VTSIKAPLFPCATNFTLFVKYWLVPGTDSSVIYIRKNCLFHNPTKLNNDDAINTAQNPSNKYIIIVNN